MSAAIWTLGHSRHPVERFIALARAHDVMLIADVRGQPFSRFNPQFNRERLRASLAEAEIDYAWYGEALSGRPADPALRREDGSVDWEAVRAGAGFQADIAAISAQAATRRLALVCAEENPMHCHRRFLLTPPLRAAGHRVLHIRGDGRVEDEESLAPQGDLFG